MSILKIVKMGDPLLAAIAKPVADLDDELLQQISDMIATMRFYQGVGLAAPQVALLRQIVVLEVAQNERYPQADSIELDVLINPKILDYSEQKNRAWEGCLSIPGLRGQIERSSSISYQAMNRQGKLVTKTVHDFHARIIQHEVDHLNGILYPQRLDERHEFGFEDSLPAFKSG